jgi:hypothetical protein
MCVPLINCCAGFPLSPAYHAITINVTETYEVSAALPEITGHANGAFECQQFGSFQHAIVVGVQSVEFQ